VFGIAPEVCDFTKAEACALKINGWVNDKTQGMISSIVTPADFNSELLAVLANAEYFKGAWTHPFKAEDTKEATFRGTNGTQTSSMMNAEFGSTLAYAGTDFSAVILPMGTGSNFTVTLAMPAEGTSLEALAAKDVKSMRQKMDFCTLKLGMPKFKAEGAKMEVNRLVAPLGVTALRTTETSELFADALPATYDVFQSAVVSFDEQGAEAASVTWSGMATSTGDETTPKEVEITFDRPFLFYITEARTGAILFAGAVRNL
jgi:serpin B